MDKVFTIIVTYNGMKWLNKCLSSLEESNYSTSIVIIDNGSTDGSINFIKKNFPEVHIIESKENLGFGKANNQGIAYALKNNADFFFLLNQDAYVFPDTIGNLINNFKENPKYGIISPIQLKNNLEVETLFLHYIRKYPNIQGSYSPLHHYENKVLPIEFTNAALWMISKYCIEKVGGFSPLFYHYGEDIDYTNRIKFHHFKNGVSCNAFGIHDREIKPKLSVSEYNKKKQHPGPWPLKYYIILSNPNYSIYNRGMVAMKLFLTSLIKHILNFNFFSVKYDFIVIWEVIKKTSYIRRIRKIIYKKEKLAFLK